ncbi:MAG: 30S ribosomal protein S8 [Planctomycetes bacterium]|nr:30S ribosomal protein S8 [Planctomycetota bacterium]
MQSDPVADFLTRIRNALRVHMDSVEAPLFRVGQAIAECLQREGYVRGHEIVDRRPRSLLRVLLKYGPDGEPVVQSLRRVSRPGRRLFRPIAKLRPVMNGLGICVLSTSKGVLSDREARVANVGGEVLCEVK